ncbi:MAG TPA: hypothetical protein VGG60_16650, partial [Candidatus Binataceae bacterium]
EPIEPVLRIIERRPEIKKDSPHLLHRPTDPLDLSFPAYGMCARPTGFSVWSQTHRARPRTPIDTHGAPLEV